MKKKTLLIILLAVLAIAGIGAAAGYTLLANRPFDTGKAVYIYIDRDDTADSVYMKLRRDLHVRRLAGFRLLSTAYGYSDHLHTGAYHFDSQTTTWQAFRRLLHGAQTPVRMVVPSTRTVGDMLRTVSKQIMTDSASIARLLADSTYCDSLGYNLRTLPALFLPNTYEVYWNMRPEEFIRRMQKEHSRFWNSERTAKAQRIGLTPAEVSTLASIVEEETARQTEMPVVAGLYLNRLRIGMPLQADPTVKFAVGDFTLRRILFKHLEADSPYNTYKHAGLPPGPIRIPSVAAIESVLNPAHHNYLYMCAREDFSGFHNFASTLRQHQRNAFRYQQELNRRKIK